MIAIHRTRLGAALKRALNAGQAVDGGPAELVDDAIHYALHDDEDVLTAFVFERLRYLPAEVAWRLLIDAAAVVRGTPPSFGDDLEHDLWPLLPHPTAPGSVEPDVLWRSGLARVGVEVKWKGLQTPDQIDSEYAAIAALAPECAVAVLALGGAGPDRRDLLARECGAGCLLVLGWSDLYRALRAERAVLQSVHERCVIEDIIAILALRDPRLTRTPLAFSSLPISIPTYALQLPWARENGSVHVKRRPAPTASQTPAGPRPLSSLPRLRISPSTLPEWSST